MVGLGVNTFFIFHYKRFHFIFMCGSNFVFLPQKQNQKQKQKIIATQENKMKASVNEK